MAKALVIVESPAKARTLGKYLGKDYKVEASVGHIKDLPKKRLGVNIEKDFEPEYEIIHGKKKVVLSIRKEAKDVETVYLASDPDREGEAIAWHLREEMQQGKPGKEKQFYRLLITEITRRGVAKALENPLSFDDPERLHIYEAQLARRILDRLVGYQISPILWRKVQQGLSAGRVQSVAVQFVVDREREVRSFTPEEYWNLVVSLEGSLPPLFTARLMRKNGKKFKVENQSAAAAVAADLEKGDYVLKGIDKKTRKRQPVPPFITSKLQQEASRKLRFTAKQTMAIAQRLYEGINLGDEGPTGLITYMRTDSVRVSAEALDEVRDFIVRRYGADFLPEKPAFFKNKKNIQDAHEAIRPTSVERSPEKVKSYLSAEEYKLYSLVWKRFVASQMNPATYATTTFDIACGPYGLSCQAESVLFKGFLLVYEEGQDYSDDEGEDTQHMLPDLKEGDRLAFRGMERKQMFTQPPARYTEATLVKELEEQGIGRPSTYAAILSTIQDKSYVKKENGKFTPSELGELITDLLKESFPEIMDVAFTADMENKLDDVETGENQWQSLLKGFYGEFEQRLNYAGDHMRNVKRESVPTDIACPSCQSPMAIRWGKLGSFLACTNYPACKTTLDYRRDEKGAIIPIIQQEDVGNCPKCGAKLQVKTGRYGRFVSCGNYPDCDYRAPYSTQVPCPREGCQGHLIEKRTRRGKVFYGCSAYPQCDFATWNQPVTRICPSCGARSMVTISRSGATAFKCEICKHIERSSEAPDAPADPQTEQHSEQS